MTDDRNVWLFMVSQYWYMTKPAKCIVVFQLKFFELVLYKRKTMGHAVIQGYGICIVDKKAMIRNRYNRIPHPALNTKRERDTHN